MPLANTSKLGPYFGKSTRHHTSPRPYQSFSAPDLTLAASTMASVLASIDLCLVMAAELPFHVRLLTEFREEVLADTHGVDPKVFVGSVWEVGTMAEMSVAVMAMGDRWSATGNVEREFRFLCPHGKWYAAAGATVRVGELDAVVMEAGHWMARRRAEEQDPLGG